MDDRPIFDTLPRGRHQLSREQVRTSQRGRLLLGMAETVAEKGYVRTSVADVLKRVRVSRETFYQHFSDKEQCFLAVLDQSANLLAGLLPVDSDTQDTQDTGDSDSDEPALRRLERILETYFGTLAAEASIARVFFVESYAAGPAAQRKRVEVQEMFVDLMAGAFATVPGWQSLPDLHFACRTVVGGIASLVAGALISGESERLPELAPKLIELIRHMTK